MTTPDSEADEAVRAYVSRLWAEDWDSDESYDQLETDH